MKKNILSGIFCILSLLITKVNAQQTINKTIDVGGIKRSYILYLPNLYNGNVNVPLLFCFHGYNMQASEQMAYGDFRKIADTANFILVYPQGSLMNNITHWNIGGWTLGSTANDIGFTRAMIDTIRAEYKIDTTRIYSTGYSNGGFFSFELACQMGEKIAAIGSVSGSMTPETYANCDPNHPMPVIQIHGTADPSIHYNGETFSLPVDSTLAYWKKFNQTDTSASHKKLPDLTSSDGCSAESYLYDHGLFCNAVLHFKIVNGKHGWPGAAGVTSTGINQDINASEAIWNFVSQYNIHGKIGCATLGVKPVKNVLSKLKAFPNPSANYIQLNTTANIQYTLCTLLGEIVKTGTITSDEPTINLSELNIGIYFLHTELGILKIAKTDE